ncbi:WGR domain-containing protein [uncultured Thiodictyon sp.]|uniref:WGR domain-containing protein n=1 Tax=uncultured Thiodictyon sp. TaxID=1846217 RepID=UPI0025EA2B2D|nr:WGR domain-containing protein [uncultured Thiodictyon sp.]
MRRWVHPEKARYYQADLVVDLLGDWSLITAWGGLESHRGQVRRALVASEAEGVKRLAQIERRRRQRGYVNVKPIEF